MPVVNDKRKFGVSKYHAIRYQGAFDLISILFIYKYGLNPLHFFGLISIFITIPSLCIISYFGINQSIFLLGFGEEYMVRNRPLMLASFFSLLLGVLIFLTGFVCDFVLHHLIRDRIKHIINLSVSHESGKDETNYRSDVITDN